MFIDMTQPLTTFEQASNGPAKLSGAILAAASASSPLPRPVEDLVPVPSDTALVDQSGRQLGPRALRTRARILEATVSLLDEKSMRDLRVIDIARRIGSSPATFYQYFKDVTDVVLELSTKISELTPDMVELIHGDWTGRAGHERGVRLANLVTDYWDRYKAILRVRNNAADEGDPAFLEVRMKAMLPMLTAFAEVIQAKNSASRTERSDAPEFVGGQIHPLSGAIFLFKALESIAIYHEIFERRFGPLGEGREALVETIATMLQSTLTAKH